MYIEIDDSWSICTLINTFYVINGNQKPAVESLKRFFNVTRDLKGFIGAAAHVSADGERIVNYVQWQTEKYLRDMLQLPEAKAHIEEMAQLCSKVEPIFYEVAYVGSLRGRD